MKAITFLALVGTSLLAMSSSCDKEPPPPAMPMAMGRLVRVETTFDAQGNRPLPRWEIDMRKGPAAA